MMSWVYATLFDACVYGIYRYNTMQHYFDIDLDRWSLGFMQYSMVQLYLKCCMYLCNATLYDTGLDQYCLWFMQYDKLFGVWYTFIQYNAALF